MIYESYVVEVHLTTLLELQMEISQIKSQINDLIIQNCSFHDRIQNLELLEQQKLTLPSKIDIPESSQQDKDNPDLFIKTISTTKYKKWYTTISLGIKPDFSKKIVALIDSGADLNCIQEGIIPSKYWKKTSQNVYTTNLQKLITKYKISR